MTTPSAGATPSAPGLPAAVQKLLGERIAQGKLEMPVLPEVASKVVTLSNDPTADSRTLASVVNRDPAMAGHLMRLANSPLYAPKTPLVSLDQVVSRMGMKKVREIALLITCQSKVFVVPGYEAVVKSHFRHSLAAGMFAQEIARTRRWNVEEAFLCGLLHDVGWPVLLQELVDLHQQVGCALDPAAIEGTIHSLHTHIGAMLVKGWALPARMAETIQFHHDPEKSTTAAQTAMMTDLADDLAHLTLPLLPSPRPVTEAAVREHPMLAPLNLYPDEMEALLGHRERIKGLVEAMG
jgi:putative nucleotidyltransferase with HDIG domain